LTILRDQGLFRVKTVLKGTGIRPDTICRDHQKNHPGIFMQIHKNLLFSPEKNPKLKKNALYESLKRITNGN
jgi:hypothetical protein